MRMDFANVGVWLLLALGGLLSLLVRHWVPNSQKKRELKEHIHRVRQKIKGLSGEIDSVLRVLVWVEVRALDGLRKSAYSIFPDYETVAAHCAKGIALLERRVDLIEEIDSIHDRVGGQWERCPPPSRIDFIYSLLQQAWPDVNCSELARPSGPQA